MVVRSVIVLGLVFGLSATAQGQEEDGLPLPKPSDYGRSVLDGLAERTRKRAPEPAPAPARTPTPTAQAPAPQRPVQRQVRRARGLRGALEGETSGPTELVTETTRTVFPTIKKPKPKDVVDLLEPGDELRVVAMTRSRFEFVEFSGKPISGLKVRRSGAQLILPLRNIRELTVIRHGEQTTERPVRKRAPDVRTAPSTPTGPTHTLYLPDDPRQQTFPGIPASDVVGGPFTQPVRIRGRTYYVKPGTQDWLSQLSGDAAARKRDLLPR